MNKANVDYIRRRRRFSVVLLAVLVALAYSLLAQAGNPGRGQPANLPDTATMAEPALEELPIKEADDSAGYDRERFGSGWAKVQGCDMRNRILQRDLDSIDVDDDDCTVLSGTLEEGPYTGETITFERGRGSSQAIHIDHLVAVSDAWQKGAQDLDDEQRRDFYNDPLNLLAVDSGANLEKGGDDVSGWMPRAAFRCRYVARQIAVKAKYALWVTKSEYNAMRRILGTCPQQVLPIVEEP